jgi:hypothetical protein
MFNKLICNGLFFKRQIVTFFSKASEDINMDDISIAGEFMMYTRAWFWISQFDWEDEEWIVSLKSTSSPELLSSLLLSIKHFEELEEYEKCSFLKKISDFVQENLEK